MEPKPEQTKETNICSTEVALDYATLGVLHSKETEGLSALRCSEVEGDAAPLGSIWSPCIFPMGVTEFQTGTQEVLKKCTPLDTTVKPCDHTNFVCHMIGDWFSASPKSNL